MDSIAQGSLRSLILGWIASSGPVTWSVTCAGYLPWRSRLNACDRHAAKDYSLLPSRVYDSPHSGTRQYARILDSWIEEIGLDPTAYGTHTMRRTKASLIYRRTKLKSTVRYLGIEVEDALELSEQTEI